jgi:hypothetical protein
MATRYQVSLAHERCAHTGSVVWEERRSADAAGDARPIVVSLARGFVSVTAEDGSIEILCSGCTQTVAAATFAVPATAVDPVSDETGTAEAAAPADAVAAAVTDADIARELERLFGEHPDVSPIRGDLIPNHLVDRLRHLASRRRRDTA